MDARAETELEMVERHVNRGEIIIAQQIALIERLTHTGRSTVDAKVLLTLFRSIQAEHLLHLARLRIQTAAPSVCGYGPS